MAVITFDSKGDYRKTDAFLRKLLNRDSMSILRKYGELGVERLREATPKRTGRTANSWSYTIDKRGHDYTLTWTNSNIAEWIPVVILIQYGHGTRGGTWVEGRDFINPALRPIFDELSKELRREVSDG